MSVTVHNIKALIDRLNPTSKQALELAAALSQSNTHHYVEVEHWLLKLLEPTDGDLPPVLRHFQIDRSRAVRELTAALEQFRRGRADRPGFATEVLDLMREAWTLATLEFAAGRIRSGHLFAALVLDRGLRGRLRESSAELGKIEPRELREALPALLRGTSEDVSAPPVPLEPGERAAGARPGGQTPALDQYTQDLTARAREGKIDPVLERDFEIRQVIDILTRRRQNNPILTGEAGVGKTAVVEGLALRIVAGDVPDPLKNVSLRTLDLALLQAGAGVKGEFENRLKTVLSEVKASPAPIILFIDEAHTMIGAGGQQGQGDAANLLKPALARGELRTIAATTWAEYKKYFEDDAALKRRFQVVKVGEPAIDSAVVMMRGLVGMLEKHHKVRIMDDAIEDSVKLSARYITDRQLPDKSVSLLDTACARVALSQTAIPPAIEDTKREIQQADTQIKQLEREQAVTGKFGQPLGEAKANKAGLEQRLTDLTKRWEEEKKLVESMREARTKLEAGAAGDEGDKLRAELAAAQAALSQVQGEEPLVLPVVTSQSVAEVVSGWTGVPVGKMVRDEIKTLLNLKDKLEERVVGQSYAMESVSKRIQTARANLADPSKPLGVFLLVGPSGVGKTETAVALSDILYGGDRNMVVINLSEYQDSSSVSNLKGSAKGLVGYGTGGVLTEPVRRRPYSVVLLDEFEKAHKDVQQFLYQVFDKGMLQDSTDNMVNFNNTIILLTSNVGTDTIKKLMSDPDTAPDAVGLAEALRPDLLKAFEPALLGRLEVVPYLSLGEEILRKITQLKLGRIVGRVRANHRAELTYDDAVLTTIVERCKDVEDTGARNIDSIVTQTLLPELAREFLARIADGVEVSRVRVGVGEGGFTYELT